jgi:hypothetical protein
MLRFALHDNPEDLLRNKAEPQARAPGAPITVVTKS